MARGRPDWGIGGAKSTIAALDDMGELAARLGSIVTFDRRGDVVWLDDFESGIAKWIAITEGTGSAVASSTTRARSKATSIKLTAGTDLVSYAYINHLNPIPVAGKIGMEFSFTLHASTGYIILSGFYYNGTRKISYGLQYDQANARLMYLNDSGIYTAFKTSIQLSISDYLFHTAKLVIDLQNKKYVRAVVNDTQYDLSDYAMRDQADTTNPYLDTRIQHSSIYPDSAYAYIDDFILTQNEP